MMIRCVGKGLTVFSEARWLVDGHEEKVCFSHLGHRRFVALAGLIPVRKLYQLQHTHLVGAVVN